MTAHIVLPPRLVEQSSMWWTECTCGESIVGESEQDVRDQAVPHRSAERERVGQVDRARDEDRRLRREQRRAQRRSKVEGGGKK